MTRGEGHTRYKKSSGMNTKTQSREGKSSGSGAAAEDNAGSSHDKLSKSQLKALLLKKEYRLPNFFAAKDDDTLTCCHGYYKAYANALDETMGEDFKSLLDCVQQLVEQLDDITNPEAN